MGAICGDQTGHGFYCFGKYYPVYIYKYTRATPQGEACFSKKNKSFMLPEISVKLRIYLLFYYVPV